MAGKGKGTGTGWSIGLLQNRYSKNFVDSYKISETKSRSQNPLMNTNVLARQTQPYNVKKERNYPIFFSSLLSKLPTPFSTCPALASNFPLGGFAAFGR